MNKAPNQLEAKILAQNLASAKVLELLPEVCKALKAFEGKKIFNQGNTLSQKARQALPVLPNDPGVSGWYQTSNYSITVYVKVSCLYPDRSGEYHSCVYQEATAHVAEIHGNDLKSVYTGPWTFRTDWTAQEIKEARERLKAADKAKREAESNLYTFGEYDN